MTVRQPRNSKKRWDTIMEDAQRRFLELMDLIRDDAFADGEPPFNEPLDDINAYRKLLEMRAARIPAAFTNEAEEELRGFERRFGRDPWGIMQQTAVPNVPTSPAGGGDGVVSPPPPQPPLR